MYHLEDSEERSALSSIPAQISMIADKLDAAQQGSGSILRGLLSGSHAGSADAGAQESLLGILDGLYNAMTVDSGLRELLTGK